MTFLKPRSLIPVFAVIAGCADPVQINYTDAQKDSIKVVSADDIYYQPLNPARGEASPQAGVLWGDIRKDTPSGMLLKFAEGFSSPPHIHNITYRAIVISGEIHNDDPDAANMWMGPGTFWTQPAGEVHITSARPGIGGTGFLEILEGPYLVEPGDKAFDNGERPLNLVNSNMVWMTANEMNWIDGDDAENGAEVTLLWGDLANDELSGSMIRLPSGQEAKLSTHGGDLKAVLIQGNVTHTVSGATQAVNIDAGSFVASEEGVSHSLTCTANSACLIYVRTKGRFHLK